LFGLGQQYQTARQDTMSGISNIFQGGLALGSAIDPEGGMVGNGDPLKNLFTGDGRVKNSTNNVNQAQNTSVAVQRPLISGNVNQFDPNIINNRQSVFTNESSLFQQTGPQGINNPFYFR
jgi:hypothetical protein